MIENWVMNRSVDVQLQTFASILVHGRDFCTNCWVVPCLHVDSVINDLGLAKFSAILGTHLVFGASGVFLLAGIQCNLLLLTRPLQEYIAGLLRACCSWARHWWLRLPHKSEPELAVFKFAGLGEDYDQGETKFYYKGLLDVHDFHFFHRVSTAD